MTDWLRFESIASVIRTDTDSPSIGLDNSLYGYDVPFFPSKNPLGQWYANFGTVGNRNSVAATSEGGRDEKVKLTTRLDMPTFGKALVSRVLLLSKMKNIVGNGM